MRLVVDGRCSSSQHSEARKIHGIVVVLSVHRLFVSFRMLCGEDRESEAIIPTV